MNDMGRFVLCIERFCRLRIAEKGHGQINTVKLLKKNNRGGGVEVLLPKVGVTRASKNPGLAIAGSEA
jgi:hypothetical protein